jgi:hypothetical protein
MRHQQTQSRPLVLLKYPGYNLFIYNINSPGLLRLSSLFLNNEPQLWTNAVTCCCKKPNCVERINGMISKPFFVEFWQERKAPCGSIAAVEVLAPSCWSSKLFLDFFLHDLAKLDIISLVNTYFINGCEYPFNTINTMHC